MCLRRSFNSPCPPRIRSRKTRHLQQFELTCEHALHFATRALDLEQGKRSPPLPAHTDHSARESLPGAQVCAVPALGGAAIKTTEGASLLPEPARRRWRCSARASLSHQEGQGLKGGPGVKRRRKSRNESASARDRPLKRRTTPAGESFREIIPTRWGPPLSTAAPLPSLTPTG